MKKRKKDKLVGEDVKLDTAPVEKLPHGLPKKKRCECMKPAHPASYVFKKEPTC